jgi:hypothetical protein
MPTSSSKRIHCFRVSGIAVAENVLGISEGCRIGCRTILGKPFATSAGNGRSRRWLAVSKCDCGNVAAVDIREISRGRGGRCDECRKNRFAATFAGTKFDWTACSKGIYRSWKRMLSRCNNSKSPKYKRYGARGISVCSEWMSFPAFVVWANANGHQDGLSLDRINNDGNYEPSNCQWITVSANSKKRWSDNNGSLTAPFDWNLSLTASTC